MDGSADNLLEEMSKITGVKPVKTSTPKIRPSKNPFGRDSLSQSELEDALRQAGWDEKLIPTMSAIGMAESALTPDGRAKINSFNPGVGPGGRPTVEKSYGNWQINMHPSLGRNYDINKLSSDPVYNAKAALDIYRQQGLKAWGAYTDGRYKKFYKGRSLPNTEMPSFDTSDADNLLAEMGKYTATQNRPTQPDVSADSLLSEMQKITGGINTIQPDQNSQVENKISSLAPNSTLSPEEAGDLDVATRKTSGELYKSDWGAQSEPLEIKLADGRSIKKDEKGYSDEKGNRFKVKDNKIYQTPQAPERPPVTDADYEEYLKEFPNFAKPGEEGLTKEQFIKNASLPVGKDIQIGYRTGDDQPLQPAQNIETVPLEPRQSVENVPTSETSNVSPLGEIRTTLLYNGAKNKFDQKRFVENEVDRLKLQAVPGATIEDVNEVKNLYPGSFDSDEISDRINISIKSDVLNAIAEARDKRLRNEYSESQIPTVTQRYLDADTRDIPEDEKEFDAKIRAMRDLGYFSSEKAWELMNDNRLENLRKNKEEREQIREELKREKRRLNNIDSAGFGKSLDNLPTDVSEEEIDREQRFRNLSKLSRAEREEAQRVGQDVSPLSAGIIGGGGRGISSIAGILRPFSGVLPEEWYGSLSRSGQKAQLAEAVNAEQNPGVVNSALRLAGGLPSDISRLLLLSRLPGGAVVGFAADAGLQSAGRGESNTEIAKQTLKGGALGALFSGGSKLQQIVKNKSFLSLLPDAERTILESGAKLTPNAKNLSVYLTSRVLGEGAKIGTIGAGTFGVEKIGGATNEQALHSAITNVLTDLVMSHAGKIGDYSKIAGKVFRIWKDGKVNNVTVDEAGSVRLLNGEVRPEYVDGEIVIDADSYAKSEAAKNVTPENTRPLERIKTSQEPAQLAEKNPLRIERPNPEAVAKLSDKYVQKIDELLSDGKAKSIEDLAKSTRYSKENISNAIDVLYGSRRIEILPDNTVRKIADDVIQPPAQNLYEKYSGNKVENQETVPAILNETKIEQKPSSVDETPILPKDEISEAEKVEERTKNIYENLPQQKEQVEEVQKPKAQVDYKERPDLAKSLTVFTERGRKAQFEPKVVEESDLLTSLDEGYPMEFQPRDRTRLASKAQISEIANKLNPEFLGDSPKASDGRPLVVPVKMPDGSTKYAVISGNGRTAGIREAYQLGNENSQKYKEFATSKGGTNLNRPVYVGILDPEQIEDFPEFAKESNESSVAQMSASEQAKADADRIDSSVLNLFVPADDGTIHGAANRDFVRAFLDKTTSTAERNRFVDSEGKLNQEGVARVKNAIFAKAFGNSKMGMATLQRMAESTDSNIKNITNALLAKAGELSSFAEAAKDERRFKELDIAPDFARAMEKYSELKDSNTSLEEYIQQGNLFGADTSPLQTRVMQVFDFYKRRTKSIRRIIDNYIQAAEAVGDPKQSNLFGENEIPSKESIFEAAVRTYEREDVGEEAEEQSLFDQDQGRKEQPGTRSEDNAVAETEQITPTRRAEIRRSPELAEQYPDVKPLGEKGQYGQTSYRIRQAMSAKDSDFLPELAKIFEPDVDVQDKNAANAVLDAIAASVGRDRSSQLDSNDWQKILETHAGEMSDSAIDTILGAINHQQDWFRNVENFINEIAPLFDKIEIPESYGQLHIETRRQLRDIGAKYGLSQATIKEKVERSLSEYSQKELTRRSSEADAGTGEKEGKPSLSRDEKRRLGLERNFRAGTNDATLIFDSPLQRDLYDYYANEKKAMRGGSQRAGDSRVKDLTDLKTSLAERLKIPENKVFAVAKNVSEDVKAQMKGVRHLEEREVVDNVNRAESDEIQFTKVKPDKSFIQERANVQLVKDKDGNLLAPNGKKSNLNEALWRTVRTPQFLNWFGDWINRPERASKVVDENGEPLVVFSGHGNVELYGDRFVKKNATAGGFYATESTAIASSYATGKLGNYEEYSNGSQYRFKQKNGKWDKKLHQIEFTPEQQKIAREYIQDLGYDVENYWRENARYDADARRALYSGGLRNPVNIFNFLEGMGENIVYPSTDENATWAEKNPNSAFEDILDKTSLDWRSYERAQPGVFPLFLNIRNPIDSIGEFPQDLLTALEQKAKRDRNPYSANNTQWTRDFPLRDWVQSIKDGDEYWSTQIPAKALPIMQEYGYDGIRELGSKGLPAEQRQVNWIAFEPGQIKSLFNRGTFDPQQDSILFTKDFKIQDKRLGRILDHLNNKDVRDLSDKSKAEYDGDVLKLSPEAATILRTAITTMRGRDAGSFYGFYAAPNFTESLKRVLGNLKASHRAKNDFKSVRAIAAIENELEKASKNQYHDLVVIVSHDAFPLIEKFARQEELSHRADYRTRNFENKETSEYQKLDGYNRAFDKLSKGSYKGESAINIHREIIAKIYRDDADEQLGISWDEVDEIQAVHIEQLNSDGVTPEQVREEYSNISEQSEKLVKNYESRSVKQNESGGSGEGGDIVRSAPELRAGSGENGSKVIERKADNAKLRQTSLFDRIKSATELSEAENRFIERRLENAPKSERDAVKLVKDKDGNLLAPNGKKSNLNENLWRTVRTPSFKRWFGDWEKNPEKASKVVDENGEPQIHYHGTLADIDKFDKSKLNSATGSGLLYADGFFFTPDSGYADLYAKRNGNILPVFLNLRNPLDLSKDLPVDFFRKEDKIRGYQSTEKELQQRTDSFNKQSETSKGNILKFSPISQIGGYDGVIASKGTEVVVFEPNQIKSVFNQGTFDAVKDEIMFAKASTSPAKDYILSALKSAKTDNVLDLISSVKSLKATADLSAAGRQGWILSLTHPRMAFRSFIKQLKSLNQKQYQNFKTWLNLHPSIELAEASDLYLSTLADAKDLNEREEAFMSRLFGDDPYFDNKKAEKIRRGITFPIRKAEDAYKTYLDNIRIETFTLFAKEVHERLKREGASSEDFEKEMKGIAKFINYATGRGEWGSPLLNATFFSTRYWESRLQLLNPVFYGKLPPKARNIALKNMAGFVGATALLMLIWKLGGGELEWDDVDDPNTLKLKWGNYSYDISAGLVTHLRYLGRMASIPFEDEPKRGTKAEKAADLTIKYGRSKLSPVAGSTWNALSGKNFIGEPTSWKEEVLGRDGLLTDLGLPVDPLFGGGFTSPMQLNNFYEAAKADGTLGLIKILPEFVGYGATRFKSADEYKQEIEKEKAKLKPNSTREERKEIRRRIKAWQSLIKRSRKYSDNSTLGNSVKDVPDDDEKD